MRDPVIGSFGAIALLLVIALKAVALTTLLEREAALPFLVAAPALSRWTIVGLAAWLPYARSEGGLGQALTRERDTKGLLLATATTAAVTIGVLRTEALLPWALALLVMVALGRAARLRIGGVTGDVFGASVELTETTVLVGGVLLIGGT
jgi:adenosylcobinamide-GDP ribazoletransferase